MNAGLKFGVAAALASALLLTGCASKQVTLTDPERDPWEAYNRKVHAFNMGFDRAIFRPVARGYDYIMPDAPQRGVRNFFRNLAFPVTFLNAMLQGKPDDAFIATGFSVKTCFLPFRYTACTRW